MLFFVFTPFPIICTHIFVLNSYLVLYICRTTVLIVAVMAKDPASYCGALSRGVFTLNAY